MIGQSGMLSKSRRKALAGPIIAERDERFEFVPSWALIRAMRTEKPEQAPDSSGDPNPIRDMIAYARTKWAKRRTPKEAPADSGVRIAPEPPKLPMG